jgi:hypothetical protein
LYKEKDVNIHTEKEKELVRLLLRVLKKGGIEIPVVSQRESFVNQHAPKPSDFAGKLVGYVGKDLRLMIAIASNLAETSGMLEPEDSSELDAWDREWDADTDHSQICRIARYEIAMICLDSWRTLLRERFAHKIDLTTHYLVLKPDWSVRAIAKAETNLRPFWLGEILDRVAKQLYLTSLPAK